MASIGEELENATLYAASRWDAVPKAPGFYSIFVDDPSSIKDPYGCHLRRQATTRLYIGIASKSLFTRLVEQDLRHRRPSTFFRSIGAILNYRPEPGSLAGMKNKRNYKFSEADTEKIREWIRLHVRLRFLEVDSPGPEDEKRLIYRFRPILNTTHNPERLACLADLRLECRQIACSEKN